MTTLYDILSLCASQSEQYDILFRYDRSLESVFTVLQDNTFSALGIIDQTGKLLGIVDAEKVLQTITKHRYDNIERVQQSNGKFHHDNLLRVVLDESPMLIILKDWDGRFLMVNKALASLYNTTPEEIIGKTDGDFNPNVEQVAFYKQNIQDIMRLGETCVVYEESTDSITGETHYYQSIKKPLKDAYNNDAILVIANDITDIKKTQQKIEQSERRLGYALEAIKEGVWDWDIPSGKLLHNATWYTMLGYNDDEMKGSVEDFIMCLYPDDKESVMNAVNACLEGKASYVHEHRMQTKEGHIIWVHDRGNVVERDKNGAPLRMVGSFANITERKLAEEALKELNTRLEEKVNENVETIRQKDQMLLHQAKLVSMGEMMNAIAHQWRQPLNAIGLIIQDIREESRFGELNDEYLNDAVTQGMDLVRFMSQTIDNFRHFFRPETSGRDLFDIRDILEETLSIVRTQMEFHEISVCIEGESFSVEGYRDEFKQVLLNLLGNARDAIDSYREHNRSLEGKVCFRLNAHKKTLQCIDNGGGIPLTILPRIFEPYFTTKEQGKGTGIGLYMSKMIMDKMQGKFQVENNNEGACFTLIF